MKPKQKNIKKRERRRSSQPLSHSLPFFHPVATPSPTTLHALLNADLIGFHTFNYSRHFLHFSRAQEPSLQPSPPSPPLPSPAPHRTTLQHSHPDSNPLSRFVFSPIPAPFRPSPSILLNPLPPNPASLPIEKWSMPSPHPLPAPPRTPPSAPPHHRGRGEPAVVGVRRLRHPTASITSPPHWTNAYNPSAYCPIHVPAINVPTQTNAIILAPIPQPLPVPCAIPPYDFETPTKHVSSPDDIHRFHSSAFGRHFLGFVAALSRSIHGCKISDPIPPLSQTLTSLLCLLQTLTS